MKTDRIISARAIIGGEVHEFGRREIADILARFIQLIKQTPGTARKFSLEFAIDGFEEITYEAKLEAEVMAGVIVTATHLPEGEWRPGISWQEYQEAINDSLWWEYMELRVLREDMLTPTAIDKMANFRERYRKFLPHLPSPE